MRLHSKASVLFLGAAILLPAGAPSRGIHHISRPANSDLLRKLHETVVLSDSLDAYFSLAVEIADRDGLRLELEIDEALEGDPAFLLYVISPGALSEQVLTELGIIMRDREAPVALGFITGSTIESARRLYNRKFSYSGGHAVVDGRAGTIEHFSGDSTSTATLDSTSLLLTLRNASYICYSGHGGAGYWRLSDEVLLTARVIEPLSPIIVASGACSTFEPWDAESLPRAFIDRGAAVYAGFLFSPAPYYHFGFPDGFPLEFTYPDFPIGIVTALQNRGSLRSYAVFPFYFVLGDPRVCFRQIEPYRLIDDRISGEERVLLYERAPEGFVPVRIEGGAEYPFVEIEGIAAAGEGDVFYNSKIQFLDFHGDRYLLFDHEGGDFAVRLKSGAPFLWTARDAMIDALDHAFVYLPMTGGILFLLIVAASVLFVTVVYTVRSGGRVGGFYAALAAGLCVASWRGLYALLRADVAAIVSVPLRIEPRFIAASLILAGCGAFLYFNIRSRLWRAGAVLVMTFPAWVVALFWAAGITYVNIAGAVPRLGTRIYSYKLSIMPAAAFAVECLAVLLLLRLVYRSRS